ncbi:hypothetical protein IQ06DRAFT_15463 [Phaeosphaeriaceae sp. SRC1lsM3a]|nr:hypothetical protein IQ06DRAFT_15463 [Stagonospora sp. SRC1lsM3a]
MNTAGQLLMGLSSILLKIRPFSGISAYILMLMLPEGATTTLVQTPEDQRDNNYEAPHRLCLRHASSTSEVSYSETFALSICYIVKQIGCTTSTARSEPHSRASEPRCLNLL